jgi:hypothetical protein
MTRDRCLRELADVRATIREGRSGYLFRTRLKRLVLSCNRLIAKESGLLAPTVPGRFAAPSGGSEFLQELAASCRRVYSATLEACQPSEALDERWRRSWSLLDRELGLLEGVLRRG